MCCVCMYMFCPSSFPTKNNRKAWALENEIHSLILQVVMEREKSGYKEDLLQMLLQGAKNSELNQHEID